MNAFPSGVNSTPRAHGSFWPVALYNLRFFLSCLHPKGWRQYTEEYPRLERILR